MSWTWRRTSMGCSVLGDTLPVLWSRVGAAACVVVVFTLGHGCTLDRMGLGGSDSDNGPTAPPIGDAGMAVVPTCSPGMVDANEDASDGCEYMPSSPPDEICDGSVDKSCSCTPGEDRACGTAVGACEEGTQYCDSDGVWSDCLGGTGPAPESCNGMDDDCDGSIDGLERACGTGMGICAMGIQFCTEGTWEECTGGTVPEVELCDTAMLDEDCDGARNEECACIDGETQDCASASLDGTQSCDLTGTWGPCQVGPTTPEPCNGRDDNGNGLIDEDATCPGCNVHQDGDVAYLFCDMEARNWDTAERFCARLHYHLVVVNAQAEQDYLTSVAATYRAQDWWIGLKDEDNDDRYENNEWVQGSSSFRNWDSGEPGGRRSACVELDASPGNPWHSTDCSDDQSFICESR